MSKNSHTPGPWEVQPYEQDHGASLAIVAPANGWVVAVIPYDPSIQRTKTLNSETVRRYPDDLPNANLLATSPDLLEAAEEVIATWEKGDLAAAVRKLDTAIAKAGRRK